jgi:phosphoribosyl 1,2-cyclic phosphodiesterase
VLTHEHVDHAQGALPAARRWNWPIYGSRGTIAALRRDDERLRAAACDEAEAARSPRHLTAPVQLHVVGAEPLSIDGLTFTGHAVNHDASEPLGYVVEESRSGARAGIAVDLGHAPTSLTSAFADLDLLVVESNHDVEMLRNGPYPVSLKRRIASRRGHLSNVEAGQFAASCAHRGLRQILLAHLSETNNRPEHALGSMRSVLAHHGLRNCTVTAATQRQVTATLSVTAGVRRAIHPEQLQLAL